MYNEKMYFILFFMMIISENMMAQVYRMINKYENIPQCILSEVEKWEWMRAQL